MKLTKTNKILILLSVFIVSLFALVFAFNCVNNAKAEEEKFQLESKIVKIDNTAKEIIFAKGYEYKYSSLSINNNGSTSSLTKDNFFEFSGYDFENDGAKNDTYFCFNAETTSSTLNYTVNEGEGNEKSVVYSFSVVVDKDAPVYNQIEYESKKADFEEKLQKNAFHDENENIYKPLGSSKYVKIPSMEEFVSDDVFAFDNLTYKVYYKVDGTDTSYNSSTTTTSTNFQIPVKVAGHYKFYVVFTDAMGNVMNEEDAKEFIFEFDIFDNYPVKVEATNSSISAYLNEKYIGTKSLFTTDGVSSTEYTLTYSSDNVEEYAELSSEDKNAVNFSTTDLSFTPNKEGYYKITCLVKNADDFENDAETIIHVTEKPESEKENEDKTTFGEWVSEHVLAVVFLGIGVLCLIGIIILLFIKPKDDDEIEDSENKKSNKETSKK